MTFSVISRGRLCGWPISRAIPALLWRIALLRRIALLWRVALLLWRVALLLRRVALLRWVPHLLLAVGAVLHSSVVFHAGEHCRLGVVAI
jgi:hypothetical protein